MYNEEKHKSTPSAKKNTQLTAPDSGCKESMRTHNGNAGREMCGSSNSGSFGPTAYRRFPAMHLQNVVGWHVRKHLHKSHHVTLSLSNQQTRKLFVTQTTT